MRIRVRTFPVILFGVVFLGLSAETTLAAKPTLTVDWGISPEKLQQEIDDSLKGSDWRHFAWRTHSVTIDDRRWRHYFVFHDGELVAQGYRRSETPETPERGTISDIVSYDNEYWMADHLGSKFGEPGFEDVRTKSDFSEELGSPARRAERSVKWDLKGERFRWETDRGAIRYTVKYSLTGTRDHHLVRVRPGSAEDYHFFRIARAFRRVGIRVLRRFEKESRETVTALVTASGEVARTEVETEGEKLVPVEPERNQFTRTKCELLGRDCRMTFYTYGGWVYRVDLELSSSGRISGGERGALNRSGERAYRRFTKIADRLETHLGEPVGDTSISASAGDRRERRIHNIPRGREAFWTVWYDAPNDLLVRHLVTGEQSGTRWHVDHRVTFRLHSVARAIAAERSWKAETRQLEQASRLRRRMERSADDSDRSNSNSGSNDQSTSKPPESLSDGEE